MIVNSFIPNQYSTLLTKKTKQKSSSVGSWDNPMNRTISKESICSASGSMASSHGSPIIKNMSLSASTAGVTYLREKKVAAMIQQSIKKMLLERPTSPALFLSKFFADYIQGRNEDSCGDLPSLETSIQLSHPVECGSAE